QRYRRGQLDERTFQSIKSQIAQRAVGDSRVRDGRDGVTVELYPARRPVPLKAKSPAASGNSGVADWTAAIPRPAIPVSPFPGPTSASRGPIPAVRGPAAAGPGKP